MYGGLGEIITDAMHNYDTMIKMAIYKSNSERLSSHSCRHVVFIYQIANLRRESVDAVHGGLGRS